MAVWSSSVECHRTISVDESALALVMAWRRQATSHLLSRYWPRSISPCFVTNQQCVDTIASEDLATQGVRAPAAILLTYFSKNIPDSVSEGLKFLLSVYTQAYAQIARFMGPTRAHLCPVTPRWAPSRPHEPCYWGCFCVTSVVAMPLQDEESQNPSDPHFSSREISSAVLNDVFCWTQVFAKSFITRKMHVDIFKV